jgi:hypothetical protein
MKRISSWLVLFFFLAVTDVSAAGLGRVIAKGATRGLARSTERSAVRSADKQAVRSSIGIQRRDAWNHLHTPVRPLPAPRTVFRYTSPSQAQKELRTGIAPGRHMTTTAPAGRPPSPATAARQYGLRNAPGVRETVVLPKGFPVRHDKVPGGRPGVGEITSPKKVPPSAIKRVTPLHNPAKNSLVPHEAPK